MVIVLFLLLMASCPSFINADSYINADWPYIAFDDAMKSSTLSPQIYATTTKIIGLNGYLLYEFFKNIYEQHGHLRATTQSTLKIPKIIHQIWLGSPVPESFKELQQSWIDHHMERGWLYKLWTDEDVAQMNLYNQEFYDATDNYGVKSDILRWEILCIFGGVYVDMDYECLQPLDELHYLYDFYTALQPLDTAFIQLGAALCGSRPNHPILQHCIETIKNDWHHKGAPKKTGPVHFTKSFYAMANHDGNIDIAFPALYFYPLGCQETIENRVIWTQQGAFAVHWWAKSWMPKNYRRPMFSDIKNDASTASWND